jgi:hypothetical protein
MEPALLVSHPVRKNAIAARVGRPVQWNYEMRS